MSRPWPNPTASRPWPVPQLGQDGTLLHHISDTHYAYRPWSAGECEHLLDDALAGLIPPVGAVVHTGDIIDGTSNPTGLSVAAQDGYMLGWLADLAKGAPVLLAAGNHDIAANGGGNRTAADWATVYGQAANYVLDLPLLRLVSFAADSCSALDGDWIISDATWTWLDAVVVGATTPVALVSHYPPWELGGAIYNSVQPTAIMSDFIGDHPGVVGMLCGHMHLSIDSANIARFLTMGGRTIPVLTDISAMLSLDELGRDQSARVPSTSAYVSVYPDRWEVRYRGHGPHAWTGPGGQRLTTLDLATATVAHSM